MNHKISEIVGSAAWALMLAAFLGSMISVPLHDIIPAGGPSHNHTTSFMPGNMHRNARVLCPYCIAHHITSVKVCRMLCSCGFTRPVSQEPRTATDALTYLLYCPGREIGYHPVVLLRGIPALSEGVAAGVKRRLIKPPGAPSPILTA